MREPAFLRKNKLKWLEYESQLFHKGPSEVDADRLAELYIQLTDDLAYARTFYPKSKIVKYLNGLAARTHLTIYKNKKEKKSRIRTFWVYELPLLFREARKYLIYAALIFTVSFAIGLLSAFHQADFLRVILGDAYVNMTIENIEKGDPLGVYGSMPQLQMFVMIAFNNVRVMFLMYVAGILFSIGTIIGIPGKVAGLFQTGVMVGAFLGFFHTYNLFWEAVPIVYIHGTLELTAVIFAGGAGLMLGNSILFPGTFTRLQSLQKAAGKTAKMMVGLVPVILLAAFLESYITRLTFMPLLVKLLIILLSLLILVGYYIAYPIYVEQKLARLSPHERTTPTLD